MQFGSAVGEARFSFILTNIDDTFVLVTYVLRINTPTRTTSRYNDTMLDVALLRSTIELNQIMKSNAVNP